MLQIQQQLLHTYPIPGQEIYLSVCIDTSNYTFPES